MMLNEKKLLLRRRLRELTSAVVAFSGGVDSSLLALLASQELKDKMYAATAVSPSLPSQDKLTAQRFCKDNNIQHIIFETDEFEDPQYTANTEDRCYYCKNILYQCLKRIADEKGCSYIIEGTNASDLEGHRPGFKASVEKKYVVTPLVDCKITKEEVRMMARDFGLNVSEKPASACLSSRIPYGTKITPDLLTKIDKAEEVVHLLGIKQVRVRHHGDIARIEIPVSDFISFIEYREKITKELNTLGYKFITLDISGYRTGGIMK